MDDPEEQSLPAGRMTARVTRRGASVVRPLGPWSESVYEYLRHLEAVGFDPSPRVLAVRDGREELTYLGRRGGQRSFVATGLHGHRSLSLAVSTLRVSRSCM